MERYACIMFHYLSNEIACKVVLYFVFQMYQKGGKVMNVDQEMQILGTRTVLILGRSKLSMKKQLIVLWQSFSVNPVHLQSQ